MLSIDLSAGIYITLFANLECSMNYLLQLMVTYCKFHVLSEILTL